MHLSDLELALVNKRMSFVGDRCGTIYLICIKPTLSNVIPMNLERKSVVISKGIKDRGSPWQIPLWFSNREGGRDAFYNYRK